MYIHRKRLQDIGRQVYKRKGMTDSQLRFCGTVLAVIMMVILVALVSMAIYYGIKNGGL